MEIRLRESYMVALAKLGTAEQERIQKFLSKLNRDPTTLGLNIEPIDNGFVSIRANQRIRVIAQQQGEVLLLHYIGDHDPAYEWAKKRRLLASLESGTFRFDPDDELEACISSDKLPLSPQDTTLYGKQVVEKLAGADIPAYIVRSLETCQSEDELYERLETLPENFQYATLAAIKDIPYQPSPSEMQNEKNTILAFPKNADMSPTMAEGSDMLGQMRPAMDMETAAADSQAHFLPSDSNHSMSKASVTTLDAALTMPIEIFDAIGFADDTATRTPLAQAESFLGTEAAITYEATRLLFRAKLIEQLDPLQSFRIITPFGAFEMTKAEFHRAFSNVVASASYRENGIYHYASLPRKALAYRVGGETKL